MAEKHKNYYKQYDEKKLELNSRKKEIEGFESKKEKKREEDKNEEEVKGPMTNSTFLLVDRAI